MCIFPKALPIQVTTRSGILYKEDGELKGVSEIYVAFSEEEFNNLEVGDDWKPKYDYLLFKKAVETVYNAERK